MPHRYRHQIPKFFRFEDVYSTTYGRFCVGSFLVDLIKTVKFGLHLKEHPSISVYVLRPLLVMTSGWPVVKKDRVRGGVRSQRTFLEGQLCVEVLTIPPLSATFPSPLSPLLSPPPLSTKLGSQSEQGGGVSSLCHEGIDQILLRLTRLTPPYPLARSLVLVVQGNWRDAAAYNISHLGVSWAGVSPRQSILSC